MTKPKTALSRTLLTLLCATVVLTVAVACSNRQRTATENITIAQFGDFFLYLPLYIAKDRGFFSNEGLNVTIISTGGDEKTWAAVFSGNAQFGIADPTFIAISAQRGQPGKIVGTLVSGVPFWGVTKNNNVPTIKKPSDLSNFRVATFPSPSTAYTLQAKMFKDAGLSPNISQGPPGTLLQLLDSGQADIALELEPNVSTAVKNGARVVYSLAEQYGDFAITGIVTTDKYIQEHPSTVERTVKAIQLALNYIRSNPSDALKVAATRFSQLDPSVSEAALRRAVDANIIPAQTVTSIQGWSKATTLRKEIGDLEKTFDVNQLIDNSFAEKALKN